MRRTSREWTVTGTVWASAGALALALYVASVPAQGSAQTAATARVDFEKQVRPIIEANCLECHSRDKRKGGLSLATYEDVLEGGRSGPIVRPGKSQRSLIVDRLSQAPPK